MISPHLQLRLRRRAISASVTIAGFAASLGAIAAEQEQPAQEQAAPASAAGMLEEIVVSAQRRSESLMNVPIAMSAIDSTALEKQNVDGVEDVLQQMPNVSFVSLGSRDRKDISLRGISNQLNPFADVRTSTYAFYIDEFNVALGTTNPEIVDLERIEVLRGPQGTYFGRNAVGGALNVTTKKPVNNWYSEVGLGIANYNARNAHVIVNAPLVDEKLAMRASGQTRRTDGFIDNINAVGGGDDGEFNSARVSLRFTPTERITWDLNYSYTDGEEGMRVGVPTGFLTATWRQVYYQNAPGDVANPDGVGFYPENRSKVNFNRPQRVGTEFDYVSTRFLYEFDTMTLTAVAGQLNSEVFNYGDVDGGSIDAFYEDYLVDRESKTVELRLQSSSPQLIDWSIGAILGQDAGVVDQSTYHGAQSPLGRPDGFEATGTESNTTIDYWAIFGQATWHITSALDLTLGGRYSTEDVDTFGQLRSNQIVTSNNDRTTSFTDFSPRVSLGYKPNSASLLYATASKGFKAGGAQNTSTPLLRNEYDPEELWNYEVGYKSDLLNRRLRVDLSVFYMDWKDVQQFIRFQSVDPVSGLLRNATGVANATSARTYGVEFTSQAALTDRVRVGGQVGYLKANYGRYSNALIDGLVIDASGKRLINAPEWTAGLHAEYNREFGQYDGFVRLEGLYRSEQLSSTLALRYETFPLISPSYETFNLRVGFGNERWRVSAFAENLFDEEYFSGAYEKAFYSGVQVEPSTRFYGLDVKFSFGEDG